MAAIRCKASVEALISLNGLLTEITIPAVRKANASVFQKLDQGLRALRSPKDFGGEDWGIWWKENKAADNEDLTRMK